MSRARIGRRSRARYLLYQWSHPSDETWQLIEGWIEPAANRGHRFAVTDLLIAGLAHEADALVWSLDADFERMESLKMVRLYSEPTIGGAQR